MVTDEQKSEIKVWLGALERAMPGFRMRQSQRMLIGSVATTLSKEPGKAFLVAQAGTGTGKSLGYSVPAMVMARALGKKLVISSSTVALQEQLSGKDLPMFIAAGGKPVKIALAKGRTRYLCEMRLRQKLEELSQGEIFSSENGAGSTASRDEQLVQLTDLAQRYSSKEWDGDRDSLKVMDDTTWRELTVDRHQCLNRSCSYHKGCAQISARKGIGEADVIVANHSIVLADLSLGGGKLLPAPDKCFYIFDEAHELIEKAVSAFAAEHFVGGARKTSERLRQFGAQILTALGAGSEDVAASIQTDAKELTALFRQLFKFLDSLQALKPTVKKPAPVLDFPDSSLPEDFFEIGDRVTSITQSLEGHLAKCKELSEIVIENDPSRRKQVEKMTGELGFFAGWIEKIWETWRLLLVEPKENQPPVAKWIETVSSGKGSADFKVCASPVMASGYLKKQLWDKAAGAVMTSATITALGSFDDFLRRSGLRHFETTCLDLPSPFDFFSQGTLEIPRMPVPKDVVAHTTAITSFVSNELGRLSSTGALVLFTSRKQMNEVFDGLPAQIKGAILVQDTLPKAAIIAEHKRRVDAGQASVIFGLDSFSTGIDLPDRYCTLVVIAKLPFNVPDDPILKTLSRWIENRGGNPFLTIHVPNAARKLEQQFGRLIRTETDTGRIVVLDPRLWTMPFGKSILRGLPRFRTFAMGREVAL